MGRSRRKGRGQRAAETPAAQYAVHPVPARPWLPWWLALGAIPLFLAACTYGFFEVHSSTDTYIGLAAGRQIVTSDTFPVKDTFSYTFEGATWFNQNWLTHVIQWLLYNHLGPNWVIYGTWAQCVGIFSLVLLATWLRCRSWLAATLAASMVAVASRDWLSARPATMQFLLFALFWLSVQALLSQEQRRRWWPVALLALTFLVWPHAHGSFIFGYALLGMFLGSALVPWVIGWKAAISRRQWVAIAGVAVVTAVLGAVLSPYGLENYLHPFKVAESEVFRRVGEWRPPFDEYKVFPPVYRYWVALGAVASFLLGAFALKIFDSARGPAVQRAAERTKATPLPSGGIQMLLLDIAAVAVGLTMSFWARRFAPLLYILATPVLATWILRLGRSLSSDLRVHIRDAFVAGIYPLLVATIFVTARNAHQEIIVPFQGLKGEFSLLDRITRTDQVADDAMKFLRVNGFTPKIMTEWTQAGLVMFYVPGAQVYIDGRSQQVYDEQHYLMYSRLMGDPHDPKNKTEYLERVGTEAVLLRRSPSLRYLIQAVNSSPDWLPALQTERALLFVYTRSPFMKELLRREHAGELWWPDEGETLLARGRLLAGTQPYDFARAIELWKRAIEKKPILATQCLEPMRVAAERIGDQAGMRKYLDELAARFAKPVDGLSDFRREQLIALIGQVRGRL